MYQILIYKYDRDKNEWITIPAYIDEGKNPSSKESFFQPRNYRVKLVLENRPADETNKPIGEMIYGVYPEQDALDIQKVQKFDLLYKGVGTQLFAFALFKSLKAGKEGRVELLPINNSKGYWEYLGFEFKPGKKEERMWLPDDARKEYVAQVKNSNTYKNEFTPEPPPLRASDSKP